MSTGLTRRQPACIRFRDWHASRPRNSARRVKRLDRRARDSVLTPARAGIREGNNDNPVRTDYVDRLRRVLRHIQLHLDDDLTPDVCADVANFSRYHFHRVFSGESIGAHVRRLRLERAAGELRRTDRSVIDIAVGAGYDAHEPFTRAFKTHFGEPPAVFRRLPEPVAFPRVLCGVHYGADDVVSRFVPLHEDSKMIDVRLEAHPVRHLLARTHRGDHQLIGRAFDDVYAEAGRRGLLSDATSAVGIYYDDPPRPRSTTCDRMRR